MPHINGYTLFIMYFQKVILKPSVIEQAELCTFSTNVHYELEKCHCCQPASGNPTVRDERGACGNVSHGGIRNPLHKPKGCMMETLHLKLSAPYFYPTRETICFTGVRFEVHLTGANPVRTCPQKLKNLGGE